jgi:hypothetical protein
MTKIQIFFDMNDKNVKNDDDYVKRIFRNVGYVF